VRGAAEDWALSAEDMSGFPFLQLGFGVKTVLAALTGQLSGEWELGYSIAVTDERTWSASKFLRAQRAGRADEEGE